MPAGLGATSGDAETPRHDKMQDATTQAWGDKGQGRRKQSLRAGAGAGAGCCLHGTRRDPEAEAADALSTPRLQNLSVLPSGRPTEAKGKRAGRPGP